MQAAISLFDTTDHVGKQGKISPFPKGVDYLHRFGLLVALSPLASVGTRILAENHINVDRLFTLIPS